MNWSDSVKWLKLDWTWTRGSLGIVAPALGQLLFKRSPGLVLGVYVVLINRVLEQKVRGEWLRHAQGY